MSKYHIVGNHMSGSFIFLIFHRVIENMPEVQYDTKAKLEIRFDKSGAMGSNDHLIKIMCFRKLKLNKHPLKY